MLESGKNASGQEAFGSKAKETLVGDSSAVSTADVTSAADGTGATAASEADKAEISTAPTTKEEGGDLCMADPLPTSGPMQPRREVHAWWIRCTGANTPTSYGRRRSSPTATMSMSSRRHRARSGVCCR
jgi:hypothetical protein